MRGGTKISGEKWKLRHHLVYQPNKVSLAAAEILQRLFHAHSTTVPEGPEGRPPAMNLGVQSFVVELSTTPVCLSLPTVLGDWITTCSFNS